MRDKSGDYKPLLVCHDGGIVSETAAALARLAKCEAKILSGGYAGYRQHVQQHLSLEDRYVLMTIKPFTNSNIVICILVSSLGRVASYRFLVITGPRQGGRAQLIRALEAGSGAQVLDLDTMSREEGGEVTQEMFESRIMHTLIWQFSPDKVCLD